MFIWNTNIIELMMENYFSYFLCLSKCLYLIFIGNISSFLNILSSFFNYWRGALSSLWSTHHLHNNTRILNQRWKAIFFLCLNKWVFLISIKNISFFSSYFLCLFIFFIMQLQASVSRHLNRKNRKLKFHIFFIFLSYA